MMHGFRPTFIKRIIKGPFPESLVVKAFIVNWL